MPHLASRPVRPTCASLCGDSSALLLVFTNAWSTLDRFTLDALRRELAALSVALLVVGDDGIFYFNARPDGAAQSLPSALETESLSNLRQLYGGTRRQPSALTLSLVEADGRERFRISRKLRGGVPVALLEALQLARESVALPARFRAFSERDVLFYSLVGALNLVLSEGTVCEAPASSARAYASRR